MMIDLNVEIVEQLRNESLKKAVSALICAMALEEALEGIEGDGIEMLSYKEKEEIESFISRFAPIL